MLRLIFSLIFLFLSSVNPQENTLTCVTKCSCEDVNPITDTIQVFTEATNCCDVVSTGAKGNLFISGVNVVCTLCPSLCDTVCELVEVNITYSANVTRPAAAKFLYTVTASVNCPGTPESELTLFFARGASRDDLFITVNPTSGQVSIVVANPPNEIRPYSASVDVDLYMNSVNLLYSINVPITFMIYDAIEANATEYIGEAANSRVGGLYLFTVGTDSLGFDVDYSIKPLIGDPNSISINSTTGHTFTSTILSPLNVREYEGVILMSYTSQSDSLSGVVEVQFTFSIVLPLTPSPSSYDVMIAFPPTIPQGVLAFTITYAFFQGFSLNSLTYDLIDIADILSIDHSTGRFSYPFDNTTEVKRYPDSGNTGIIISYFSKEMYLDSSNYIEPVYKGSISADYSIRIVDPCGFSEENNPTCENESVCELIGLTFNCDCTDFFEGPTCGLDINECSNATFCNTGQCANTFGGFDCNCTEYYTGETCIIDVNECDVVPSICVNGGVCTNSIGGYSCDCTGTGYDGKNCQEDIDECFDDLNLCSPGVCSNTNGSFLCNCSGTGHRGDLCEQEIDECTEQPGICQNGNCTNDVGSYTCNCISGYAGSNCGDNIDECTMDVTLCNPGVCLDTDGSYNCDCTGTGFGGEACTDDIDECSSVPDVCLNSGVCVNTVGSFSCNCAGTGYTGGNCSIDINECMFDPPVCQNNGSCVNIAGEYNCECAGTGYEGENCETNINECNVTADICGSGECIDTDGSYLCVCDGTGFVGTNCEDDINECDQLPNVCQNGGNCSNLVPFYACNCDDTGYTGANCQVDINECMESSICNNGSCFNNNGSFSCVCDVGYTGPLCQMDIVECDTVDICNNGSCNNSPGSFTCSCSVGYTGQLCDEDVNECTSVPTLCTPGTCSNLLGSYSCDCTDTGYRGVNCNENINECIEDVGICNYGNCTDLNGSYSCDCFQGFTGANCSTNIDECEVTAALCNNGTCIDTVGSYTCMCTPGITGYNCETDVNECLDTTLCAPGNCTNTLGNYTCDCTDTGYEGRNCTRDIDECVDLGLCGPGDCVNAPGSFSCNCTETGFTGTRCETDINECTTPSPCLNSGTCLNTPGSYECNCIPGFTGSNCEEDIDECLTVNICNQGTCVNNIGSYSCSCPEDTTGPNCNITVNGTAFCPADMECTSDSECMTCLCHRNFSYVKPVSVLLSDPLEFDGDMLLPFEREIQPEIVRDVTIFAKLRQTSFDQGYVMFIGSSTVYRNLGLYLDSNSSTAYLFYTQAGADSYTTISIPLDVLGPSTHSLAVVLNFVSGEASFYKDGILVGAPLSLTGLPDYKLGERKNSRVMFVGGRIENLFKFTGWMEYVFIYPFCLSQQQIATLHNEGPITYDGIGRCRDDVSDDVCVPRPFYNPSVPTQHHSFAYKTRCDLSLHSSRGLSGMYTCSQVSNAQECSVNSDCSSGYACGEYLYRDGHSLLPAVFDPYFHGFKYALVEQQTYFDGSNPITISITKRPILTLDLTIFVKFQQASNNEGYVVAKGVSAHARDFGLYLRGTSDTVWFVYKSKTGFHDYAIFSNIIVDDGLNHTMAAVLLQAENSRFVYLYVDGIPRGCVKINSRVVFTPEVNRLTVGGRPGTDNFNFDGIIYKLHIYDVALSYSVISDLHEAFSNDLLVRYCTPLQSAGDSCYIERRPPFFKCGSDLGCVPSPQFNRTHPVLPKQDICYGVPYTMGQCLSCDCPTSNEPVCGTNGVTYANDCFLTCSGATLLTQGACLSYSARFDLFAGGSE